MTCAGGLAGAAGHSTVYLALACKLLSSDITNTADVSDEDDVAHTCDSVRTDLLDKLALPDLAAFLGAVALGNPAPFAQVGVIPSFPYAIQFCSVTGREVD